MRGEGRKSLSESNLTGGGEKRLLQWKVRSEYGKNALSRYKIRNHEVSMELLSGLYSCLGILAGNTILTTGNRYEIENVISWMQKLKGLFVASIKLKTLDNNH